MRCEWKACDVASVLERMPWLSNWASSWRTVGSSPEMTTLCGPFKAAMVTWSPHDCRAAVTCGSAAKTAAIRPPGGKDCMSRARSAISFKPSSSENTPAMQAAANSPTLWPITAAGSMPQLRHRVANAYSMANITGCV